MNPRFAVKIFAHVASLVSLLAVAAGRGGASLTGRRWPERPPNVSLRWRAARRGRRARKSARALELSCRRSVAPKNDDRRAGGGDPLLPHADGSDPAGPRRGRRVTHDRRHRVARTL